MGESHDYSTWFCAFSFSSNPCVYFENRRRMWSVDRGLTCIAIRTPSHYFGVSIRHGNRLGGKRIATK